MGVLEEKYNELQTIYKRYMDMREDYMPIPCCWLLGAYLHNVFPSYPYLFLNAMKGSGKSRFLKLGNHLLDGTYTVNITEAVLFREKKPLFLDEIESISRKEASGLRELLNVAYKKGSSVKRIKDIKQTGEKVVESHDIYKPVCLANITGLDDVLEDRCVKIVLEKSFNKRITRMLEMFEYDPDIIVFKNSVFSVVCVDVVICKVKEILHDIFYYYYNTTLNSYITTTTYNTLNTTHNNTPNTTNSEEELLKIAQEYIVNNRSNLYPPKIQELWKRELNMTPEAKLILNTIEDTELMGRDLELWLPLFVVGSLVNEEVLGKLVKLAEMFALERQEQNIMENRDVILISHLANTTNTNNFIGISDIVKEYKEDNESDLWFNTRWVGRALIRNNLIKEKRRVGRGVEVMLNFDKIYQKAKMFGIEFHELTEEQKKVQQDVHQYLENIDE